MKKAYNKYRTLRLRGEDYETPGERMPGEKRIIVEGPDIDYSCFKKSTAEKEVLKLVKLQSKLEKSLHA
jgi:hypothetical protein